MTDKEFVIENFPGAYCSLFREGQQYYYEIIVPYIEDHPIVFLEPHIAVNTKTGDICYVMDFSMEYEGEEMAWRRTREIIERHFVKVLEQ